MQRSPQSHKGENGKVAVVGGSETIHGAPIFSALAAEASGVDLIFLTLPRVHATTAKTASLNFQVHPFEGDEMEATDLQPIWEMLATVDVAVIGPGLDRSKESLELIRELVKGAPCPLVLDASALQAWTLEAAKGKTVVVTPHLGELERMKIDPSEIGEAARTAGVVIHCKGPVDRIAGTDGMVHEIAGGNAGLTVGGTGDALAGLIAGLIAQGIDPVAACETASTIIKRAGEKLLNDGASYTTRQVIAAIPSVMNSL